MLWWYLVSVMRYAWQTTMKNANTQPMVDQITYTNIKFSCFYNEEIKNAITVYFLRKNLIIKLWICIFCWISQFNDDCFFQRAVRGEHTSILMIQVKFLIRIAFVSNNWNILYLFAIFWRIKPKNNQYHQYYHFFNFKYSNPFEMQF